ncbi:hypothetical protein [Ralstonia phage RSF1]|uniref:Uncharacterized protein n=1 Tax=Ralstonia phage RSF1 TaxID=1689679 RepID=A0A0K2QQP6_9CAUD|nr:hypothetical protein AVU11_gp128 [Ralstonia phage RSF1]BAS04920.1 hypothetical protein [Ralstonia phage RSF1]
MLKIDKNGKGFRRIQSMAMACFKSEESIAENLHLPDGHANITVSGFVVRTLYKNDNGPINENLMLKKVREGRVYMPYENIKDVMLQLHVSGVVHPTNKGYVLTDSMMEIIVEFSKPKEETDNAEQA